MNEKTFTFMLRTGEKYSMTTKNRLQDTSMKHTRVVAFRKTPLFASGGLLGTTRPIHFKGPHDPRVSISYRLNQGQLIEQLPPLLPRGQFDRFIASRTQSRPRRRPGERHTRSFCEVFPASPSISDHLPWIYDCSFLKLYPPSTLSRNSHGHARRGEGKIWFDCDDRLVLFVCQATCGLRVIDQYLPCLWASLTS